MDRSSVLAFLALLLGYSYFTINAQDSYAFDRPNHSAVLTLAFIGTGLTAFDRLSKNSKSKSTTDGPLGVQLSETRQSQAQLIRCIRFSRRIGALNSTTWLLRSDFGILVSSICVRVALMRHIVWNDQCVVVNLAPCSLLVLALFECWSSVTPQERAWNSPADTNTSGLTLRGLSRLRYGFLLPVFLLSFGSLLSVLVLSEPRSSYICKLTNSSRVVVPILQLAGLVLDAIVVWKVHHSTSPGRAERGGEGDPTAATVGQAFLVSAFLIAVGNALFPGKRLDHRDWTNPAVGLYLTSALRFALASCFTFAAAVRTIGHIGLLGTGVIGVFTSTYVRELQQIWTASEATPPLPSTFIVFSTGLMITGLWVYFVIVPPKSRYHESSTKPPSDHLVRQLLWVSAFLLLVIGLSLYSYDQPFEREHPVDRLIDNAETQFEAWLSQASSSKSLAQGVMTYRRRYSRSPPPNFDKWYDFATDRASFVLDDFDRIEDDLAPFWSLTPEAIRLRTWEMINLPDNAIAGLKIRNGTVELSDKILNDHRWMLEALQQMVAPFLKWIPDMDLAFNLNDECRVAVPFDTIESLRQIVRPSETLRPRTASFSDSRAKGWDQALNAQSLRSRFKEYSWHTTFDNYGSIGCPHNSMSRSSRHWQLGTHCTNCVRPHTYKTFVQNWILAGSPCHQPDLANLHGLYLSPAAFKATHDLMPIFSQSKAFGFNDILYPSPWNYIKKTAYEPNTEHADPNFAEKKPILFWRGASSEGVSSWSGSWKGMTRQRLVHLFNNSTDVDAQIIVLPNSERALHRLPEDPETEWRWRAVSPSILYRQFNTSLRFAKEIVRCGGPDCIEQKEEFAPQSVELVDFQEHWQYKYLIDVDGAGFSGRFLPFLKSKSLVFKAALMREWFDGRITAWKHFVPVDLRLAEVWSLLAYFAGWKADEETLKEGAAWLSEPHEEKAERIAESGREWAEKALRTDDMEIYLFRLLLEWGRLTDDNRNMIGYSEDL